MTVLLKLTFTDLDVQMRALDEFMNENTKLMNQSNIQNDGRKKSLQLKSPNFTSRPKAISFDYKKFDLENEMIAFHDSMKDEILPITKEAEIIDEQKSEINGVIQEIYKSNSMNFSNLDFDLQSFHDPMNATIPQNYDTGYPHANKMSAAQTEEKSLIENVSKDSIPFKHLKLEIFQTVVPETSKCVSIDSEVIRKSSLDLVTLHPNEDSTEAMSDKNTLSSNTIKFYHSNNSDESIQLNQLILNEQMVVNSSTYKSVDAHSALDLEILSDNSDSKILANKNIALNGLNSKTSAIELIDTINPDNYSKVLIYNIELIKGILE